MKEKGGTCVRSKFEVANTSDDILVVGIVKMTVDNLFGKSERSFEPRHFYENKSNDTEKKRYLSRTMRRLSSIR